MAGQIILIKPVNNHVYTIEVRYLSLLSIVNPLHARIYWPFQSSASFVDPFCYLCFMLVFAMPSCLLLVALWSPVKRGWPLCVMFSCILLLSHVVLKVGSGALLCKFPILPSLL